jgi:hypothetical protein
MSPTDLAAQIVWGRMLDIVKASPKSEGSGGLCDTKTAFRVVSGRLDLWRCPVEGE